MAGGRGRRGKKQGVKRPFNISKHRSRYGGAGLRQPVQYFKRTVMKEGAISYDPVTGGGGGLMFRLSDVPNHTEFTNLYDQYKIKAVKVKIVPRANVYPGNDPTSAIQLWNSQFFTAIDYDSAIDFSDLDSLLQYQNCKMTRSTQIHKRYLKPRVRSAVQIAGGLAPAFGNSATRNQWLDCANDAITHYGLLWYAQPQFTSGEDLITKCDLVVTYYMAFKNVR